MILRKLDRVWLLIGLLCVVAVAANAQSFRVQCPTSTITHPDVGNTGINNSEPAYLGPTSFAKCTPGQLVPGTSSTCPMTGQYMVPTGNVNGAIKCQQISGGDGYSTMADGTQTYMFSFGPLSGLYDIAQGLAGTQFPHVFNTLPPQYLVPGDPATTNGAAGGASYSVGNPSAFTFNGAVGLAKHVLNTVSIADMVEGPFTPPTPAPGVIFPPGMSFACSGLPASVPANTVTVYTDSPLGVKVGDQVIVANVATAGFNSPLDAGGNPIPFTVTCVNNLVIDLDGFYAYAFTYTNPLTGLGSLTLMTQGNASTPPVLDGHVDPRPIMDVGVMNGNQPAPLMAFDEDDEFFLTLTNVGMIMRPDLFEQHTVHFHGYPNASSIYDGVPEPSVAINIAGSFTYYYLAPDAGTYFWHCHITPPEHLQMGMVGQLYVRPRQDRVPAGTSLYASLQAQQADLRTACRRPGDGITPSVSANPDILCANPLPAVNSGMTQPQAVYDAAVTNTASAGANVSRPGYAYNDGDGSTYYDVEYSIQIHGFDPNFHFVGMTFNPEGFVDMKDKYFLLNGRSYPDTVTSGPQATQSADGKMHYSQPLPSLINIPVGGKALIRLSDLSVSEYATLSSLGIRMHVIGYNAKLLRDQAGNNMDYYTNSVTIGGGESLDFILDASDTTKYSKGQVFYLYTRNLDHLSNDAENFGGMMTEIHII